MIIVSTQFGEYKSNRARSKSIREDSRSEYTDLNCLLRNKLIFRKYYELCNYPGSNSLFSKMFKRDNLGIISDEHKIDPNSSDYIRLTTCVYIRKGFEITGKDKNIFTYNGHNIKLTKYKPPKDDSNCYGLLYTINIDGKDYFFINTHLPQFIYIPESHELEYKNRLKYILYQTLDKLGIYNKLTKSSYAFISYCYSSLTRSEGYIRHDFRCKIKNEQVALQLQRYREKNKIFDKIEYFLFRKEPNSLLIIFPYKNNANNSINKNTILKDYFSIYRRHKIFLFKKVMTHIREFWLYIIYDSIVFNTKILNKLE